MLSMLLTKRRTLALYKLKLSVVLIIYFFLNNNSDRKMESNKRERCINWESEEKRLLRDIVGDYLSIIENKDLSTNTNKAKLNAWLEITERFNSANARNRDKKQLMNQWKLAKLKCQREISHLRREQNKTGGGPKPPSPPPEILEIAEMIPLELEIDYNEFDCDSAKEVTYVHAENMPSTSNEEPIYNVDAQNVANTLHEEKCNVQNQHLRTPSKATPLVKTPTSKKNNFNFSEASFQDMHMFRELKNDRLQKEHELRMKHMSEQHAQLMTNLKLQEKILKKNL